MLPWQRASRECGRDPVTPMTPTTGPISREPRLVIGIDLGDKQSQLCVLDGEGTILEESRLQTKPDAFRQRFGGISPARIAIEAGTHSP